MNTMKIETAEVGLSQAEAIVFLDSDGGKKRWRRKH
jgi:hypothetical protein